VVPRLIASGHPGDLCIVRARPDEVLGELDSDMVAATVIAGRLVFER
jgi:hypothetical protein